MAKACEDLRVCFMNGYRVQSPSRSGCLLDVHDVVFLRESCMGLLIKKDGHQCLTSV